MESTNSRKRNTIPPDEDTTGIPILRAKLQEIEERLNRNNELRAQNGKIEEKILDDGDGLQPGFKEFYIVLLERN